MIAIAVVVDISVKMDYQNSLHHLMDNDRSFALAAT